MITSKVKLKEISEHLRFRDTAKELFDSLVSTKIIFDFKDIKTVSRSFAHEFVYQKKQRNMLTKCIGMSADVKRVFDIVTTQSKQPRFDRSTWQVRKELTV